MKKQPTLNERLASWKEVDIDGSVAYQTSMGEVISGGHQVILCQVAGAKPQRVILLEDENRGGRITLLNLTTMKERETWAIARNTCAEELRFDLRQIALDGAKILQTA
jgi:hypothetical protein